MSICVRCFHHIHTFPDIFDTKGRRFLFHPGKFICIYDCDNLTAPACLTMGAFLIIVCYGPIVLCHVCIFRSVRQHNVQLANSRQERDKRVKICVNEISHKPFVCNSHRFHVLLVASSCYRRHWDVYWKVLDAS